LQAVEGLFKEQLSLHSVEFFVLVG
jgi:hypothetical protein